MSIYTMTRWNNSYPHPKRRTKSLSGPSMHTLQSELLESLFAFGIRSLAKSCKRDNLWNAINSAHCLGYQIIHAGWMDKLAYHSIVAEERLQPTLATSCDAPLYNPPFYMNILWILDCKNTCLATDSETTQLSLGAIFVRPCWYPL
jgi:hypothetical protein